MALDREEILKRCEASANDAGLYYGDLMSIINMFEHHNIEEAKIGNIIKQICTRIEYNKKCTY